MSAPNFTQTKVLVIGANSFIGAHLVSKLIEHEAIVHATYHSNLPLQAQRHVREWLLDVTDMSAVRNLFQEVQPDYIFNMAGHVNGYRELENVVPTYKTNLEGSINVLTAASEVSCRRLVLIGSLEEHQHGSRSMTPVSPYAASKLAATAYARMFHSLYQTPVVIAQPYMVYGPQQKDHNKLVPYTILSILGDQETHFSNGIRATDWIYVDDVVDGLLKIGLTPGLEGETVELGTGQLTTVKQVVNMIYEKMDCARIPGFGQLPNRLNEVVAAADVELTRQQIDWQAGTSLEEGLNKTICWYVKWFGKNRILLT